MKIVYTTLVVILTGFTLIAQSSRPTDVSIEFQAYPTGLIPGIRIDKSYGEHNTFHARLGYNWIRHRDLGKHADERGDGFGFSLGYKRYLKNDFEKWYLGLRNDIWWNEIDWYDFSPVDIRIDGHTSITVLQPTVELGYLLMLGKSFHLSPSIAFGWEWNVKTDGEPTGEGAILLLGISMGKRF